MQNRSNNTGILKEMFTTAEGEARGFPLTAYMRRAAVRKMSPCGDRRLAHGQGRRALPCPIGVQSRRKEDVTLR